MDIKYCVGFLLLGNVKLLYFSDFFRKNEIRNIKFF